MKTTPLDLSATPNVRRLLDALRRRLRALVILYGVGTVLAVGSGWLAFAFLADWGLRVPAAIRMLHGVLLALLVAVFLWRALLRPIARVPSTRGLALLFERAHPELSEVLISAVEFQNPTTQAGVGDRELVRRVLERADELAAGLRAHEVLDRDLPRKRGLLGAGATSIVIAFALWQPDLTAIFADRMLGGAALWPQRTHLTLEVPGLDESARIEQSDEVLRLRVARGTDLPIVVTARGVVPDEVRLHFEGGRDLILPRGGSGVFRTLLRSCQEDSAFHATGGDDEDGFPRVEVRVLQPPDVESIAVVVKPPAYSGLVERTLFDQDVEVLAGSTVRVHVRPFPREAVGAARLLPADTLVALGSAPFPLDPAQSDGLEEQGPGLAFELTPAESFGFRVELEDGSGLKNPDPGLVRVSVLEDRAPEVQVLAPSRSDFAIVEGGAVPLRARASDDFGLRDLRWTVELMRDREEYVEVSAGTFVLREATAEDGSPLSAAGTGTAPGTLRAGVGTQRLEVADLATPDAPVAVDQRYVFEILAGDNREPQANEGRALPVTARVVTPEELLRRMQERLARARLEALRLSELQLEKRLRVEELVEALDSDGASSGAETVALASALSGQRRVLGDAQSLARELATVAEDILYARLDERSGALLDRYDRLASEGTGLRFRSEPWREVAAAVASKDLSGGGFAQDLVELVGLALEISEDHVSAAVVALDEAERSIATGPRLDALVRASGLQTDALGKIEALLDELAEWDNFQNILSLTRDILNRQKALRERTHQFASEK